MMDDKGHGYTLFIYKGGTASYPKARGEGSCRGCSLIPNCGMMASFHNPGPHPTYSSLVPGLAQEIMLGVLLLDDNLLSIDDVNTLLGGLVHLHT